MGDYEIKRERPPRVYETAPLYGEPDRGDAPVSVFQLTVDERGRLVLPAEVRDRLKIASGDPIALIVEKDGTISLKTREVAIRNLRGMFKHLATPGKLASDELIAERRREAKIEARKFREWSARLRKAKK